MLHLYVLDADLEAFAADVPYADDRTLVLVHRRDEPGG